MDVVRARHAWRLLGGIVFIGVAACVSTPPRLPVPTPPGAQVANPGKTLSPQSDDAEGQAMATLFQGLYGMTPADCGSVRRPAFLCSGVLLRGGQYSTSFHVWNPNPNSPKKGGVSFSWLRRDVQYKKLAYGYEAGFLVAAKDYQGSFPYYDLEVLCAFPIDADSDARSDRGCGANSRHPLNSGPCQMQRITTTAEWLSHFRQVTTYPNSHQCGFTMAIGTTDSGSMFALMPSIVAGLGDISFGTQNELIVAEWPQDIVGTLPLAAFFYIGGSTGLPAAQGMQHDLINSGGPWRPVLRLTLPSVTGGQAVFAYLPAEQAVR